MRPSPSDEIRFVLDRDSGQPHCAQHHVSPDEALEVLFHGRDRSSGHDGTWAVIGQTSRGRYLRVLYREVKDAVLIITAYDASEKAKKAYRRRQRRRP